MGTWWIGVKLDGTLAQYYGWNGIENIGKPVPKMAQRVKDAIKAGRTVKIVTARITKEGKTGKLAKEFVEEWSLDNLGVRLEVVSGFDMGCTEYWADDVVKVGTNTGSPVTFSPNSTFSLRDALPTDRAED